MDETFPIPQQTGSQQIYTSKQEPSQNSAITQEPSIIEEHAYRQTTTKRRVENHDEEDISNQNNNNNVNLFFEQSRGFGLSFSLFIKLHVIFLIFLFYSNTNFFHSKKFLI